MIHITNDSFDSSHLLRSCTIEAHKPSSAFLWQSAAMLPYVQYILFVLLQKAENGITYLYTAMKQIHIPTALPQLTTLLCSTSIHLVLFFAATIFAKRLRD